MSCEICEFVAEAEEHIWLPEAIARAYATGFASGFMLRTETTYVEYCQEHADVMRAALRAAGAKPIPIGSGGTA